MVEDLRMVAGPSTGSEMAGELNFSGCTFENDPWTPIHVEHLGQGAEADRRLNTPARVPMDLVLLAPVRLLDHA
jgi:hypothetical protein